MPNYGTVKTSAELLELLKDNDEYKAMTNEQKASFEKLINDDVQDLGIETVKWKVIDKKGGVSGERDGFINTREETGFVNAYRNKFCNSSNATLKTPCDVYRQENGIKPRNPAPRLTPSSRRPIISPERRPLDKHDDERMKPVVNKLKKLPEGPARNVTAALVLHFGKDVLEQEQSVDIEAAYKRVQQLVQENPQFMQNCTMSLNPEGTPDYLKFEFGEEENQKGLRAMFGAGNEAGMTNFNCMPIVYQHGPLAGVLTGEIPNVNQDHGLEQSFRLQTLSRQSTLTPLK